MGKRIVRNIEKLKSVNSIAGIKLSKKDRHILEKIASELSIISIEIGCSSELSMPKNLFVNHPTKFVYIRNGKQIPYTDINSCDEYFLAYQVRNQKMYIYGYFPGETD